MGLFLVQSHTLRTFPFLAVGLSGINLILVAGQDVGMGYDAGKKRG